MILQSDRGAFELFTKLPIELRQKIWESTVPTTPCLLPSPPISELVVCQESRKTLLHLYQPIFKLQPHDAPLLGRPYSIYALPSVDILVFEEGLAGGSMWSCDWDWAEFLIPEAIKKITHLAVLANDWLDCDPGEDSDTDIRRTILALTGLQTLSVIVGSEEPIERSETILDDVGPEGNSDVWLEKDCKKFLDEAQKAYPEWKRPELRFVKAACMDQK